jgi:hypothetical protein
MLGNDPFAGASLLKRVEQAGAYLTLAAAVPAAMKSRIGWKVI